MKKKPLKITGIVIAVVIVFFGLLLVFPQVLFAHKVEYSYFIIYSTEDIPDAIYPILDSVQAHLRRSELFNEGLRQRIFLCNYPSLYTLLCYPARSTFAGNWVLTGNVIIAHASIEENRAYRQMDNKTRSLVNLFTHETTHSLLEEALGFNAFRQLPTWKNEGYCDYIAQGGTLSYDQGISDLCSDTNLKSYFTYRLAMIYLIEERHLPILEIIKKDLDYQEIRAILKEKYCSGWEMGRCETEDGRPEKGE